MAFKLGLEVGEEKHASRIIQVILLSANFLLFVNGKWSCYLVVSSMFVLSLFILQAVNRRFLFLIPINQIMNRYVKFWDTLILKIFILLSASFLFLGIYLIPEKSNWAWCALDKFDDFIVALLPFIGFGFLILLPIYWYIWGEYSVKKKIVNKLKDEPNKFTGKCPICYGIAEIENRILEDGRCHVKVKCFANCAKFTGRIRSKSFENVYEPKIGFVEKPVEVPEPEPEESNSGEGTQS